MPRSDVVEQTESNNDTLRRELEGKIEKLTEKVDKKISIEVFFSILGLFVLITGGVIGYAVWAINQANDKYDGLLPRIAVLESKLGIYH